MKIHTQTRADRAHVAHLIEHIPVAMMTTIDADGSLSGRPMAALEMDADGMLWFFTDSRSAKVDHLAVVNLAFGDASNGTWVSLSGRGEVDTDRQRIGRLWTPMALPWFPDGPDAAGLALLKFMPDAADYWDAPHSTMIRAFGAIASVLAARPIGLGEKGSHTRLSAASAAPATREA